jgi:hypothetical protein
MADPKLKDRVARFLRSLLTSQAEAAWQTRTVDVTKPPAEKLFPREVASWMDVSADWV